MVLYCAIRFIYLPRTSRKKSRMDQGNNQNSCNKYTSNIEQIFLGIIFSVVLGSYWANISVAEIIFVYLFSDLAPIFENVESRGIIRIASSH